MAAESGYLNVTFLGNQKHLLALEKYIKDKIKESKITQQSQVTQWSFLEGYNSEKQQIDSHLVIEETIYILCDFAKELVSVFSDLSFYGTLSHGWLITEGPDTNVEFSHVAKTKTLWWCESIVNADDWDEDETDYEDLDAEVTEWIWNSETGVKSTVSQSFRERIRPLPVEDVVVTFPCVISIEGTHFADRIDRIEHIKVGDSVILKADWESPYYLPVAIEVFDSHNGSLGFLRDTTSDNTLVQIANSIETLHASVASVTPLSKRKKNAKYALLDVLILKKENNLKEKPIATT